MANARREGGRWTILAAAGACGAAVLHVGASLRLPLGAVGDDALQLLLARNLLWGRYALPDASGAPVSSPLPGFALAMALPTGLLSPHWSLLRGAALLAAAALAALTWRHARRLSGEAAAWAAAALVAASPALIGWAGAAVPDVPFAAACAGALLLLTRDEPPLAGLVPLAAWAALLAPEGVVLAAAVGAGLGFRFGGRRAALFLGAALAPLVLWLIRGRLLTGAAGGPWPLAELTTPALLLRAAALAAGLARGVFGPVPAALSLAGLALGVFAAASGARALWRPGAKGARSFVVAATVLLAGLCGARLFGRAWESRDAIAFLAPLAPLWGAAFAEWRPRRRAVAAGALALAVLAGLWRGAAFAREGFSAPRSELWPKTVEWLRSNVPSDDAVVTTEPYLIALTAGRRAYFPAPAPSREAWLDGLRKLHANWVLVLPHGDRPAAEGRRHPLADFDDWAVPSPPLSLAYSDDAEGTTVLKLE